MNVNPPHHFLAGSEKLSPHAPLLLLLLTVILCPCCGKSAEQVSKEMALSLSPTPALHMDAGRSQTRRVYIDASLSMKGFANVSASTPYARVIDGLGYDLDGATVYKYGQVGRQEPKGVEELLTRSAFGRDLTSPSFYDRDFNPDATLISYLASEEPLAFSVLITDGVYSVHGGNNSSQVVDAIWKWLDRGGVFGIFVFKSPFRGNIYAESRPVVVTNVSEDARPFYAFVFSPSMKELRNLEEKLKARSLSMLTLILADNVVDMRADFDEAATKGTYSFVRPPDAPYHWLMLGAEIFAQHNPSPVGYRVSYICSPDYPASTFRVDLSADYYRWNKGAGSFDKVAEGPPGGFGFSMEEASFQVTGDKPGEGQEAVGGAPNLTVFFPKDSGSDYGFYQLRLLLSPKDLRPEIQGLSTYNDDDRAEAKKTYRFYDLVSSLTQLHFSKRLAPRVTPPLFATITNY